MPTLIYVIETLYSRMSLFDKSFAVCGIIIPGAYLIIRQTAIVVKSIVHPRNRNEKYFDFKIDNWEEKIWH